MAAKKKKSNAGNIVDAVLNDNMPFAIKEAYKALRTNVTFSMPGQECSCIGFTSASRGDGKSTTALNLAISYAQLGKRVMVVDCDMRLPTIASKLKIKGAPGLSDILVGEAKVEDSIRRVSKYGIDVLTSGSIPPDATKLLSSQRIQVVLKVLRKYYDYIMVDLPPVTTVADATIMASILDGYVLVVRHDYTEYGDIENMIDQLKRADANILGFVYNGTPVTTKKYYGYYK